MQIFDKQFLDYPHSDEYVALNLCPGVPRRFSGEAFHNLEGIEMTFENSKELTMNRSIRYLCTLGCCLLALLVITVGSATAQTFRGIILGTVTDSSGGSVPGATVTIKNVDTGLTRTLTTSDDGSYSAPELPIGNYSVTVEKAGFKTGLITGVKVEVSTERRADVTLQTGQLSQKVEVLGEQLPMVETTSNNMGGIVETNTIENLPVNGRDYQKLILLVPGASSGPDAITDSPGSYGTVSVNGARGRSNNYLLDGTDMNDGYRNDPAINEGGVFATPATILPIEAIAEVHVASNFEAEYGRSAGAAINIVTKSGTNDWHGSAFDYVRNTALNARNFFDLASAGPQQPFHLNQFGGSFGGPIKHDKTFFFVDYEGVRETGAQSSPGCVPTAADISANAPTAGDTSTINPVIQNLLKLNPWPQATNPADDCYLALHTPDATVVPNTTLSTPFSNRVDNAIVKLDHEFNKNNILTGRYYIGDSTQLFPLALTGGGLLPNYNTMTPTRVQLISISYVSVITAVAAAAYESTLILEQQVEGDLYRLLYLNGTLLDAVLRRPPLVVADGSSNIRQLVRLENRARLKAGPRFAQVLVSIDTDMRRTLAKQSLSLSSVPRKGTLVSLKRVINENSAADNLSAPNGLCKSIIEDGAAAAMAVGVKLAAVDIITRDPAVPLAESGGAILEVNTTPGYHPHYHRQGEGCEVAVHVLSYFMGRTQSNGDTLAEQSLC
jgi:D-alanine-D-alanine ligase-like ATP-grasp enzyme